MNEQKKPQIDWEFYEYIIAYNCTFEDTYVAAVIDVLKLKYVSNSNIRAYLKIIFEFYRTHSKLPSSTEIKSYLNSDDLKKSFKDVILHFQGLDKDYNQEELLSNTERYLKERAVFHAVKDTVDDVTGNDNPELDTGAIYGRFEDACNLSLVDDLGFDYFNEIDRHISDLHTIDNYISTGYDWLDKMLGGGFLQSGRAIYAFAGATNSGKSILLGNLAGNLVMQNECVVIITLEMSEMVYAKRVSSKLTDIPLGSLKQESDQLKATIIEMQHKYPGAQLIIKEFPPNSINSNNIKAYLNKLTQQRKIRIGAVVIDYLTLLQANMVTGNMYSDGKGVAEQMRALTYPMHFGCPFITACQSNRKAYDEANPGIDTTGESIGIPQTVDFQASIWSNEADKELGIINVGLQKSRFGPNFGKRAFKIDYDTLVISEMDDVFGSTDEIDSVDTALGRLSNS